MPKGKYMHGRDDIVNKVKGMLFQLLMQKKRLVSKFPKNMNLRTSHYELHILAYLGRQLVFVFYGCQVCN